MSQRLLALYERTVLRRPLGAVLVVLLLALLMAAGLAHFRIDASADSLTLEYDEDLDYFRQVNQRYGSTDILVVTYTPRDRDLFSDRSLNNLQSLTRELGQVDGVTDVRSIVNVPLLFSPPVSLDEIGGEPRTLMDPGVDKTAAREEFRNSPIYKDMVLGPDGKTTGIVASLSKDDEYLEMVRRRDALRLERQQEGLSDSEQERLQQLDKRVSERMTRLAERDYQRVQEVRNLLDRYRDEAKLFLGGPTMITADLVDYVLHDLVVFGAGVVLFIILTLAIIFRQLRWVILPLASCTLAVVIMLGWLGWVDWQLTVVSSNFVAVLLIISMALTIHLVVRYRELHWRHPEWENFDLARETVRTMAKPCFYTVLTTVVAFSSLVVSNIRPVIDFGWMMTIGLFLAFCLVFVVIPAGILLWGKQPVRHRPSEDMPHTRYFARFTERHGTAVILISLVMAAAAGTGLTRLEVDNRFVDYFRSDTAIHKALTVIDRNLGGTTPLDIVIKQPENAAGDSAGYGEIGDEYGGGGDDPFATGGGEAEDPFATEGDPFAVGEDGPATGGDNYWFTRAGLEKLSTLHDYLDDKPEIGKVQSLVIAYRVANRITGHQVNDLELALMRRNLAPEIRNFLIAPYIDDAHQETRVSMRTVETSPELDRFELLDEIDRFMQQEMGIKPENYRFTGLFVLYNNMLKSLFQSQILTLGAVFLGIMVMFVILFRSLYISAIAIVPNLLAAAIVLGGMGLAGIPLDMMTITIAAITVGIGVDDTIHYIHRFQREFYEDRNYLATMHRAHGSIGKAMYYTSIIIVIGFSILTLSNFRPTIYFGLLTGVAMLVALLGALALLPKLILVFKPFGPEGETASAG